VSKLLVMEGILSISVVVAALGYFVDIYDLLLFGIVRVPSLKSLGVQGPDLLQQGVFLLNMQMFGLLVGGIFWGILGDKYGRVKVLFGSILLYSLANLANAAVTTVGQYGVLRLLAGIGLAGELGAAIALVSEKMPQAKRGYATAIVAGVGLTGAVVAGSVAQVLDWRNCYIIGGLLGLGLLILRLKMTESGIYLESASKATRRGDFRLLFATRERAVRYLSCIFVGIPLWFVIGILVTFAPEFGKEMGIVEPISAAKSIGICYMGICFSDLVTGSLSQYFKTRKKVIYAALVANSILIPVFLIFGGRSANTLYFICLLFGLGGGYWAVFITSAAEQFGTNLRATVSTTVPNFVRGAVVPLTASFQFLRGFVSLRESAALVAAATLILAFLAAYLMKESYSNDLNFLET
jgi:putative MFS transporter